MRIETKDLILDRAQKKHWKALYENVWSREETARYMFWQVTRTPQEAVERMERTMAFQRENDAWTIYEKKTGIPIGFTGIKMVDDTTCEEMGIALGPEYTGRGYGRQVLTALTQYAEGMLGAERFVAACRRENAPSRKMILACGFHLFSTKTVEHPDTKEQCTLEFYEKKLGESV